VPQTSVPEVIAAVERNDFESGVVPIENMIEGSVSVTLDTLAFEERAAHPARDSTFRFRSTCASVREPVSAT